jgi:RNA polymerase sigma-70 factor (ECF subfamily)
MENLQLSRTGNCIAGQIGLYGDMVYRISLLHLRNKEDAEDVFQEVFLKLFASDKTFESEEHRKAWLITVTSNQCKNILRSVWRKKTVALDELCAEVSAQHGEEESGLVRELLNLPLKYRRVLYLHYYEGYKTEEIGQMLKTSPATVRTRMRRGREMLKQLLLEGEER